MEYHVTLARNDVFGELTGPRFPCSIDDFNEPCPAVIVKKRTGTLSFYTLLISSELQLDSNDLIFFLFIIVREYLKKKKFF